MKGNKNEFLSVLEKISSKYILESIFNYIEDEKYKLKLFINSKLFQKKLNINLIDYQENYIGKFNLNPNDYLYVNYNIPDNYNKEYLKKKLEIDLIKYKIDFNLYQSYAVNYYKKYFTNIQKNNNKFSIEDNKEDYMIDYIEQDNQKLLNIFSPLFNCISQSDIFEYFIIEIPITVIEKYNLKNDYIYVFDKLNKEKLRYSLIYFFDNIKEINELKINVNLNQAKKLILKQSYPFLNSSIVEIDYNYNYFFKNFFSYKNFENLLYLDFISREKENYKIDTTLFNNVNNFKLLEELKLKNIDFEPTFILNLSNLKALSIKFCLNISFSENTCLNLQKLELYYNKIEKTNSLLKFPKLEELTLVNKREKNNIFAFLIVSGTRKTDIIINYDLIIDFQSLKKLKNLIIDRDSLKYFKNYICENLKILNTIGEEKEKEMLGKIILMKEIKNVSFYLTEIDMKEISNIKEINTSVTNMKIYIDNHINSCIDLLYKFPNLTSLSIENYKVREFFFHCCCHNSSPRISEIKIKENPNCKINRFSIKIFSDIEFYCGPYENLTYINIEISRECRLEDNQKIFSNSFPIFSKNCDIIFKSLTHFKFYYGHEIKFYLIENLYNNIDNMPNLKSFNFFCFSSKNDEVFYKKFMEKLLQKKLNEISLHL